MNRAIHRIDIHGCHCSWPGIPQPKDSEHGVEQKQHDRQMNLSHLDAILCQHNSGGRYKEASPSE
jgi:hypothetical protein